MNMSSWSDGGSYDLKINIFMNYLTPLLYHKNIYSVFYSINIYSVFINRAFSEAKGETKANDVKISYYIHNELLLPLNPPYRYIGLNNYSSWSLCTRCTHCVFACTLSLLLHDGPWLGHGETLHDLILLPGLRVFGIQLVRWPLQHATVKGVAVPPARLLRPLHTVNWTGRTTKRQSLESMRTIHCCHEREN